MGTPAGEERVVQALLGGGFEIYPQSIQEVRGVRIALVRSRKVKKLLLSTPVPGFSGTPHRGGLLCPLTPENAQALAALIPQLRPRRLPAGPSFGFGDRLGLATPGHIRALGRAKVFPILAQQSVRENIRTGRTFAQVLADAVFGALQEGYPGGFGADADHLKSVAQALEAARLGYTMFTCDPSEFLVPVGQLSSAEMRTRLQDLSLPELHREYLNRSFFVAGLGELRFSEEGLLQVAVKYWRALEFAKEMYQALSKVLPQDFDFELSLDEVDSPTTPLEHLFLILELHRRDVNLTSLAPRFAGDMEKAVDYRGDLEVFRRELRAHVAIARAFGPYRISLHSGSDKPSLYPILAEEARDLWHVKTAGTSYLVALEVVAQFEPRLFREILELAKAHFSQDRASYHLSADPNSIPDPWDLHDWDLLGVLAEPNGRQVLHATFGSVLKELKEEFCQALLDHEEEYYAALARHLGRHLEALGVAHDG